MKDFFQTVLGIACVAVFIYACHRDDFTHPTDHDQEQAQALRDVQNRLQTVQDQLNRQEERERNLELARNNAIPGHETWPAHKITVGVYYAASIDSTPPGYPNVIVRALIKGTVENDTDLPNGACGRYLSHANERRTDRFGSGSHN
jgi:hypothetical protein